MFITFTKTGIIACACIILASQLAKILLNKFKVNQIWIKSLPLIILLVSYIAYSIMLKDWGIDSLVSALALTALSCYFYDVIKAIYELVKSIFNKIFHKE